MPSEQKRFLFLVSPAQRLLLAVFSGLGPILAVYSLFFGWYALRRYSVKLEDFPNIVVMVTSPRYLAVNEEEELRFAIRNTDSVSFNLTLHLEGNPLLPIFISQEGTNIFWSGSISVTEQIERSVKVFIPFDFSKGFASHTLYRNLGLTIWGATSQQTMIVGVLPIQTAPIPWHRRLFYSSLSILAASGGWVTKEWWNIWKEAWGK